MNEKASDSEGKSTPKYNGNEQGELGPIQSFHDEVFGDITDVGPNYRNVSIPVYAAWFFL